jgi:hypothetical protein
MELRDQTYSQLAAYLTLLWHYDFDSAESAEYLQMPASRFHSRLERAYRWAQVQPSPFDGKSSVPRDFWPRSRKRQTRAAPPAPAFEPIQLPLAELNRVEQGIAR